MALNTRIKKLLRDSSRGKPPEPDAHPFPLVLISPTTKGLVTTCKELIEQDKFLAIISGKGDLIELEMLFQHLAKTRGATKPVNVVAGKERDSLPMVRLGKADALCFISGYQIPTHVQRILAEARLPELKLVMLILPDNDKYFDLVPGLQDRCGWAILKWPSWKSRPEDHETLIRQAIKLIEYSTGPIKLEPAAMQFMLEQPWRSVGQMVEALLFTTQRFPAQNGRGLVITSENLTAAGKQTRSKSNPPPSNTENQVIHS